MPTESTPQNLRPGPYWHAADQMMRSPLGRRAAREGWAGELFRLVLQNGTPSVSDDDVAQLRFCAHVDQAFFERVREFPDHPLRAPILALGDAERELARQVLMHCCRKEHNRESSRPPM